MVSLADAAGAEMLTLVGGSGKHGEVAWRRPRSSASGMDVLDVLEHHIYRDFAEIDPRCHQYSPCGAPAVADLVGGQVPVWASVCSRAYAPFFDFIHDIVPVASIAGEKRSFVSRSLFGKRQSIGADHCWRLRRTW
jgi:hypothetical protein